MTIRHVKYVTPDELTEAQQRYLFEGSEQVREQISQLIEWDWLDNAKEALTNVIDNHPLWSEVFPATVADDFCWDGDGCGFNIYMEGSKNYAGRSGLISYQLYEKLRQEYDHLKPQHVFFINRFFSSVRWNIATDSEMVECEIFNDWFDSDHDKLSNEDDIEELMNALDYAVDENSGDNEWVIYDTNRQDSNIIVEQESPFFAGTYLGAMLGDVETACQTYNEAADWMLRWAADFREALEDALQSEWDYFHSLDYWLDHAVANELEYELTEELENVT